MRIVEPGVINFHRRVHKRPSPWLVTSIDLSTEGQVGWIEIGYLNATSAVFPNTQVQMCIVHMLPNSLAFVSYKDRRVIVQDLKTIYKAVTAK